MPIDALSTSTEAITLNFDPSVRVAGETICGSVDFDFVRGQHERIDALRIKLRGSVKTEIRKSNNTTNGSSSSSTYWSTTPLINEDLELWTHGARFPPADSHSLSFPFRFALPPGLPASYHGTSIDTAGTISYSLEVLGARPGAFVRNRRVGVIFPVVPPASAADLAAGAQLAGGWKGAHWKVVAEKRIRRGLWGEYATVEAELTIPDLPAYPAGAPIPFRLQVTTLTKTVKRKDHPDPAYDGGKPLFPAPPTGPAGAKMALNRKVVVKASIYTERATHRGVPSVGGMGPEAPGELGEAVGVEVSALEWVPLGVGEKGEKGAWRRGVVFVGVVVLSCTPDVETENLTVQNVIHISIPFPGIGNDLTIDHPVSVHSGVACPSPQSGVFGLPGYERVLGLPPAYFSGQHHAWDFDEKK